MKTDKVYLLIENQNLRKMLETMKEDIDKNCVDRCETKAPHIYGWVPNCKQCVFGKYRKDQE